MTDLKKFDASQFEVLTSNRSLRTGDEAMATGGAWIEIKMNCAGGNCVAGCGAPAQPEAQR